jgi:hypothetical protein
MRKLLLLLAGATMALALAGCKDEVSHDDVKKWEQGAGPAPGEEGRDR